MAGNVVGKGKGTGAYIGPPRAYAYKDYYAKKKEERIKQIEKENRIEKFQSRPVPDFSSYHAKLQEKANVHVVTMPLTPECLKKSIALKKKKVEDDMNKANTLQKATVRRNFKAHQAIVLTKKPFVPHKEWNTIEPQPFNLHTENRLQERKKFDEAVRRSMEDKQKQV